MTVESGLIYGREVDNVGDIKKLLRPENKLKFFVFLLCGSTFCVHIKILNKNCIKVEAGPLVLSGSSEKKDQQPEDGVFTYTNDPRQCPEAMEGIVENA